MEENEGLEFREIGGLARVLVSWLELGSGSPDPVQAYFQFTPSFHEGSADSQISSYISLYPQWCPA